MVEEAARLVEEAARAVEEESEKKRLEEIASNLEKAGMSSLLYNLSDGPVARSANDPLTHQLTPPLPPRADCEPV